MGEAARERSGERPPSRHARGTAAALAASIVLALAPSVQAEPEPALPAAALPHKPKLSPWDAGDPRPFVAGLIDLGAIYGRPKLMLGYGKPHWEWFGAEAYALTTNSFFALYAGARASLPFFDFTMGVRDTWAYARSLLPLRDRYATSDVDHSTGSRARYLAIDYELTVVVPVPAGYALGALMATTTLDVPQSRAVYEEGIRVVMRGPFAADFRLGYLAGIGRADVAKVGVLTETVAIPGRAESVVRVGPIATVALTDHTEGVFVFTVPVRSPDDLGLWHGTYGLVGVRYRWASGDRRPHLP